MESGLIRDLSSYCMTRFQRNKGCRLECASILFADVASFLLVSFLMLQFIAFALEAWRREDGVFEGGH